MGNLRARLNQLERRRPGGACRTCGEPGGPVEYEYEMIWTDEGDEMPPADDPRRVPCSECGHVQLVTFKMRWPEQMAEDAS